jgi:hypothetical protein
MLGRDGLLDELAGVVLLAGEEVAASAERSPGRRGSS